MTVRPAVLGLLLCGCPAVSGGPQSLGRYDFTSTPLPTSRCEVDGGLKAQQPAFQLGFDVPSDGGPPRAVLDGAPRPLAWDGGTALTVAQAPRAVQGCPATSCQMALSESLEVRFFSPAAWRGVGEACPSDGGGAWPGAEVGPDGGFDAIRACGTLRIATVVREEGDGGCPAECGACVLDYQVWGERR